MYMKVFRFTNKRDEKPGIEKTGIRSLPSLAGYAILIYYQRYGGD
jgi:hypothetical protein